MFVLRKVTESGVSLNFNLGNSYNKIVESISPEEFKKAGKERFNGQELDKDIFAFIIPEDGAICYPLYAKQHSYIVTENGNTFENIYR